MPANPFDFTPLHYAGCLLDRADYRRRDDSWLDTAATAGPVRVLPVWRDRNLFMDGPAATVLTAAMAQAALENGGDRVFLGMDGDCPVFAVDLSDHDEDHLINLADGSRPADLRAFGTLLDGHTAGILAYARAILHWHRNHRFCGRCGHATVAAHGGHKRVCTNPDCAREGFPRTDAVVIMLVEHIPDDGSPRRCLMGRHGRLPNQVYSTLAGFVEPGESLENAVAREVFEEAGIHIDAIRYRGSQPWPFPTALMLGFRARAVSTDIHIDPEELQDASWFTADEIAEFGDWGDESAAWWLPRRDSIAWSLIDEWVQEQRRG